MKINEKNVKIQKKTNESCNKRAAFEAVETIRKVLRDSGVSLTKEFKKCR